jgi:hypothetical protein
MDSKRNSMVSNTAEQPNCSIQSGYSTCSEDELRFDDSAGCSMADIPIRTAPFEIMEEFEEAPEEFDLGISSYSIAHPIDYDEEMEKTPVPTEVYDSHDSYSTLGQFKEGDSQLPYSVTSPSSTLESRSGYAKPLHQNISKSPARQPFSFPVPEYQQPQPYQSHFPNQQPIPAKDPIFPVGFPTAFDPLSIFEHMQPNTPFFSDIVFPSMSSFSHMPVSVPFQAQPSNGKMPQVHSQKDISNGERIIPIQVIKAPASQIQGQENAQVLVSIFSSLLSIL